MWGKNCQNFDDFSSANLKMFKFFLSQRLQIFLELFSTLITKSLVGLKKGHQTFFLWGRITTRLTAVKNLISQRGILFEPNSSNIQQLRVVNGPTSSGP